MIVPSVLFPVLVSVLGPGTGPGLQDRQAVPTPADIEQEVLENVRHQPLADGTVDDLALPEEFLQRVADRIVRASFEERYRIVVRDQAAIAPAGTAGAGSSSKEPPVLPKGRSPGLLIVLSVGALLLACVAWILLARRRDRTAA